MNNKDIRMTLVLLLLTTHFALYSAVIIVEFDQINAG